MTIDWTRWDSDPYWLASSYWDVRPPWIRPLRPGTIQWALRLVTPPTKEPIDLELAKQHLRVGFDDDDQLIDMLISSARQYVEIMSANAFLTQTWELVLDRWPRTDRVELWPTAAPIGAILLPRFPVQSIVSIKWTGLDGTVNTIDPSTYQWDFASQPSRILPVGSYPQWPNTPLATLAAVKIQFVAGVTDPNLVQPIARQAILLMLGHWYENRETIVVDSRVTALEIPIAAKALIDIMSPVQVG